MLADEFTRQHHIHSWWTASNTANRGIVLSKCWLLEMLPNNVQTANLLPAVWATSPINGWLGSIPQTRFAFCNWWLAIARQRLWKQQKTGGREFSLSPRLLLLLQRLFFKMAFTSWLRWVIHTLYNIRNATYLLFIHFPFVVDNSVNRDPLKLESCNIHGGLVKRSIVLFSFWFGLVKNVPGKLK